jgi:hypothetical protein
VKSLRDTTAQSSKGSSSQESRQSISSGSQHDGSGSRCGSGSASRNVTRPADKTASPARDQLAELTSSISSLQDQLDFTTSPELQLQYSSSLVVEQDAVQDLLQSYGSSVESANGPAGGARSAEAGTSRPRLYRGTNATGSSSGLCNIEVAGDVNCLLRSNPASPVARSLPRSTAVRIAVAHLTSPSSSSRAPSANSASTRTREEKQRKAWETDGRRVRRQLPDGFELNSGSSHQLCIWRVLCLMSVMTIGQSI